MKAKETKRIIRRKRKKTVSDLTDSEKFEMLSLWKAGEKDFGQLTDQFNIKSKQLVEKYINKVIQELNITKESNALIPGSHDFHQAYKPSNLINEPFLDLLSPPDQELTDNEASYVYSLVFIGDLLPAMIDAGLDAGLKKYESHETAAYSRAIRLRSLYLNSKKNVKAELQRLRTLKYGEIAKDINKDWVVNELVEQLTKLKESGQHPKLILDTIDKIGKTCGAFTERIEVNDITAASPLDRLIEKAKEEVVPTKPDGYVEVYEGEVQ